MGLELPGELTQALGWVGLSWPAADEDLLFAAGQEWFGFGAALGPVMENADKSAQGVWSAHGSQGDDAVDSFRKWWTDEGGPTLRLGDDARATEIVGGALVVFAGLTLALKLGFVQKLISLIIQVAQAIQSAFATFGATLAEVPGWIALTRGACKVLIDQVINHIQTVIKDLLQRARDLFKKLGKQEVPKALEHEAFELTPMLSHYIGENDPGNPARFFGDDVVHYFDDAERAASKLTVKDGKLVDAAGQPFDTMANMNPATAPRHAIFVMDKDGSVFASNYAENGRMHHSSFVAGAPVATAGEIMVEDGTLKRMARDAGHYIPTEAHQEQALRWLEQQGIDTSNVTSSGPRYW